MKDEMKEHAQSFKNKFDALDTQRELGQLASQWVQIQNEYQAFVRNDFYRDFKVQYPEIAIKFEKWVDKKNKNPEQLYNVKKALAQAITSMLVKFPAIDNDDPNPKFSVILSQLSYRPHPSLEILESDVKALKQMYETVMYKLKNRKERLLKDIDAMLVEGPNLSKTTDDLKTIFNHLRDDTQLPLDTMVLNLDLMQKELKENQAQQLIKDVEKLLEPFNKTVVPRSKFSKAPSKNPQTDDPTMIKRLKRFDEIKSSIEEGLPASTFRQELYQMKKVMTVQPDWSRKSSAVADQSSQTEVKDNKNRNPRGSRT